MAGANTYTFDMIESLYNDWLKAKNNVVAIQAEADKIGTNIKNLENAIAKANAEGNGEAAFQYALQIQNQQAPYFSQLANQLAQAQIVQANALKAYNDAKTGLSQQEKDAATAVLNIQAAEIKKHQDELALQAAALGGQPGTKDVAPAAADANYASGSYTALIVGIVVVVLIVVFYFVSKKGKAAAPAA